ncbi:MAG: hypothetical protein PHG00_07675 [Methylococcales bacterium]|nr:hypothetical protein [Methylococcales bacterium]
MFPLDNRKILIQIILFGLIITLYDVLWDTLLSTLHLAFEWIELAIEELLEHIFHTNRQQSQLITFYLLWSMALYGLYRLWRSLPRFYSDFKEWLLAIGRQYQLHLSRYWNERSSIQKTKWVTSISISVTCLAFFAFS